MVFRRSSIATAVFLALFAHSASAGCGIDGKPCELEHEYECSCLDNVCASTTCGVQCQDQGEDDCRDDEYCEWDVYGDVSICRPDVYCDSISCPAGSTNEGPEVKCEDGQCTTGDCCPPDDCSATTPCPAGSECVNYVCLPIVCGNGGVLCGDPHMKGLRGQKIDWSGVDGGWYSLVKDDAADIQVNVRVTAPLPVEFPDRQLITGLSVLSSGHSLVVEVKNPYAVDPVDCPAGVSPCLANGGLRAVVDGVQQDGLLRSLRKETVAEGMVVSASNLPVECRQFGGAKIWARLYEEMLQGRRELAVEDVFEDWVLRFDAMAAPDWCARFIDQHNLEDVQSVHALFKIETPSNTIRLNVGINQQGDGELNWDGRVLPDLEFWQMDVGMDGLSLENKALSGLLGETARPVIGADGHPVMEGNEAFRGTIEDYRVDGPLGMDFALPHQ